MEWLSKRLHPMWHAAALCYGILGGVTLAQWWSDVSWWLAIAAIPLIGLAFLAAAPHFVDISVGRRFVNRASSRFKRSNAAKIVRAVIWTVGANNWHG